MEKNKNYKRSPKIVYKSYSILSDFIPQPKFQTIYTSQNNAVVRLTAAEICYGKRFQDKQYVHIIVNLLPWKKKKRDTQQLPEMWVKHGTVDAKLYSEYQGISIGIYIYDSDHHPRDRITLLYFK